MYCKYTKNKQKQKQKTTKIYAGINFFFGCIDYKITNQVYHIILYAFMASMKFLIYLYRIQSQYGKLQVSMIINKIHNHLKHT